MFRLPAIANTMTRQNLATYAAIQPIGGTMADVQELRAMGYTAQKQAVDGGLSRMAIPELGLAGNVYKSRSGLEMAKTALAPAIPALASFGIGKLLGGIHSRMKASGGVFSQSEQMGYNFLSGLSQGAVPFLQQALAPQVQMRGYAPNIQTQLPFLGGGYYGY